jgi:hypothetical protein
MMSRGWMTGIEDGIVMGKAYEGVFIEWEMVLV